MRKVSADFSRDLGKIKPLHGVNNGPRSGNFYINTTEYFKEAGIPFSRLHDTEYPFGSHHFVDIPCVFPDFSRDPADPASYNFALTDHYLQAILDAGTQIIYRLGVSIEHGPVKMHVQAPEDPAKWAEICAGIIRHYNEGWASGFHMNIRYWEIWNEPEGSPLGRHAMWEGSNEQFYELYAVTANRLKAEFPDIRVGGYASCGFYATTQPPTESNTEFLRFAEEFMQYITDPAHPAPLDFFSWHLYSGVAEEYGIHAAYARKLMDTYGFTEAESILDEWNFASRERMFERMPTEEGAALFTSAMCKMQACGVDIANNYDGQPFLNYCAIFTHTDFTPTKAFYALKAWNRLYRLGTRAQAACEGTGLYAASAVGENGAALLFASYAGNGDTPIPGCDTPVEVSLTGLPWKRVTIRVLTIDRAHTLEPVLTLVCSGDCTLTLPMEANTSVLLDIEPAE